MPSYKGNLGNLLQHWTWTELLRAVAESWSTPTPALQLIDAHAMAPLATTASGLTPEFERKRARLPGSSPYEAAWHKLTRAQPDGYPSTAAFTEEVWTGPV